MPIITTKRREKIFIRYHHGRIKNEKDDDDQDDEDEEDEDDDDVFEEEIL